MLLLGKQKRQTQLLTDSCKVKKILIHKERTYSIFSTFNLSLPSMSLEISLLEVNISKL